MPHIWIFSELYYPEQTSTGYLLTKTAEGLAEEFSVKVITGPSTNFLERQTAPYHEIRNNVEIFRCSGATFPKDLLIGRLGNIITQSFAIWWKAMRLCCKQDIILVVTNPPLLPFIALSIQLLKGTEFVLLIHDVYPEAIVAAGLLNAHSPFVKVASILNNYLYKRATKIISLGRDMSKLVKNKLPPDQDTTVYIPNWAENEIIWPLNPDKTPLHTALHLEGKFVVLYAGNMGRTHDIEIVAAAAKQLLGSKAHFVIVGFGAKKKWLEHYVAENQLSNISILPPQPRSEQINFLNVGDIAIISFVKNMAGVSVPSRMYNQMAAGKPIIGVCDIWSEVAEVIIEEEIGWVVAPGDLTMLVETIKQAMAEPALCRELGRRATHVAAHKYAFVRAKQDYINLFHSLYKANSSDKD